MVKGNKIFGNLIVQLLYMKKYLIIAGLALVTAGGATAALLNNNTDKKQTKKETKKNCIEKKQCSKSARYA